MSKASSANGIVRPGERITYTVTLSNAGDVDAVGVSVSDTLPANTSGADFVVSSVTVTANSSLSFTYSVTALIPLTNGTPIVNRVAISGPTAARDIVTATAMVTDVVASSYALSLTKSVSPSVAAPGSLVTYTLAYTISGDEPAFGVTVSDTLPAGVVFVSASLTPTIQNGGGLFWLLGDVALSCDAPSRCVATDTISLVARLPLAPLTNGTVFANNAIITDSSGLSATSSATVTIASGHAFSISKAADQAAVTAGTRLTYTIAYTLTGDEAAQNVMIVDTLPSSVTFISAVPTPTAQSGQQLIWNLGTQLPITNYQLLITIIVPSATPTGTLLTNRVTITDSNGGVTGTASVSTPVIALADPFIGKFAGPDPLVAGETLTFTLAFTNAGPSDAQNVVIDDPLPSSVTYGWVVSANPNVLPSVSSNRLRFNIGTLAAGASGQIVFTATVNLDAGVAITNEATITTTTPDANP
ncbi:MAG: DUF11 domain-containing protein, partial [Anaerolineae bacterium]|nr:DUF11 domain-containing protein [Anaerolineae bacterium]